VARRRRGQAGALARRRRGQAEAWPGGGAGLAEAWPGRRRRRWLTATLRPLPLIKCVAGGGALAEALPPTSGPTWSAAQRGAGGGVARRRRWPGRSEATRLPHNCGGILSRIFFPARLTAAALRPPRRPRPPNPPPPASPPVKCTFYLGGRGALGGGFGPAPLARRPRSASRRSLRFARSLAASLRSASASLAPPGRPAFASLRRRRLAALPLPCGSLRFASLAAFFTTPFWRLAPLRFARRRKESWTPWPTRQDHRPTPPAISPSDCGRMHVVLALSASPQSPHLTPFTPFW
jgi:hypothetical protein